MHTSNSLQFHESVTSAKHLPFTKRWKRLATLDLSESNENFGFKHWNQSSIMLISESFWPGVQEEPINVCLELELSRVSCKSWTFCKNLHCLQIVNTQGSDKWKPQLVFISSLRSLQKQFTPKKKDQERYQLQQVLGASSKRRAITSWNFWNRKAIYFKEAETPEELSRDLASAFLLNNKNEKIRATTATTEQYHSLINAKTCTMKNSKKKLAPFPLEYPIHYNDAIVAMSPTGRKVPPTKLRTWDVLVSQKKGKLEQI